MEIKSSKRKVFSVIRVNINRSCTRKPVQGRRENIESKETQITGNKTRTYNEKKICGKSKEERHRTYSSKDRIVPKCFRSKCQAYLISKTNSRQHKCRNVVKTGSKRKKTVKRAKCESKNRRHCKKHCKNRHRNKHKKDDTPNQHILLSPISLSTLIVDNRSAVSYDDISSDDSLSTYSTSKIDQLIKNTRERERRSQQVWPLVPKSLCNERHVGNSDNESIHSAATLVLNVEPSLNNLDIFNEPIIKNEYSEENIQNNNSWSHYMEKSLCEEADMSMVKKIKTEIGNENEVEDLMQEVNTYNSYEEKHESNLVIQSEEITTNVCSPVEPVCSSIVIKSEKTIIKHEYSSDN